MYWEKFLEVLKTGARGLIDFGELVIGYEYTPYIIITLFVIAFVIRFYDDWSEYSAVEVGYFEHEQKSILVFVFEGMQWGLLAIPLLIKGLVFSVRDVAKIIYKSVKEFQVLFFITLIGAILICVQLVFFTKFVGYRIDLVLALFLIGLVLFFIGVYSHFKARNVLSADTIWQSGCRFVVGGLPWMFSQFLCGMAEILLHDDIKSRTNSAVLVSQTNMYNKYSAEITALKNKHTYREQKSNRQYCEVLEKSEQNEAAMLDYKLHYERESGKSSELASELANYKNALKNERRSNAEIKANYAALQAQTIKEQYDDDDEYYMSDELSPDDDEDVLLGDDWE